METIGKKKLFNPQGSDNKNDRKIIGGDTTNLFNLNNVKYRWAKEMYRVMMGNFWVPEKVDLSKDIGDYQDLTDEEVRAFDGIMSFLVFLDSIQTNNIPNIADWVTAPEVSTILSIHAFQEAVHSQSYAYIIETVIPSDKRDKIYDFWRDDTILRERNQYVADIYQKFVDDQSVESFAEVVVANYILEGVYFYNGFNFFYNLASRNSLMGVADEIRYINRDELTHLVLFKNMISEILQEHPGVITQEMVHRLFEKAVDQEIEWSNHILGSRILGINERSTEAFTKYIANERIKMIGFEPLYPGFDTNPYKHLERFADKDNDSMKSNFFEATVTNYSQSSSIDGWDDF